MSTWEIQHDGQWKTFASLALGGLTRRRVSQGIDTVNFVNVGEDFDADALWSYGDSVSIRKDDTTWFQGKISRLPRAASPSEESIAYEISSPWHDLDRLLFQQEWKLWDGGAITNQYKSRVILGHNIDGTRATNGEVVTEVLNYAIGRGVSLQVGTIDPDVEIPWDEAVDITCAEAIRRVLRWTPDAVCWFDYSTTPATFNCRRRADLDALTLDVDQGAPNQQISIHARHDLQVPAVVIKYEITSSVESGGVTQVFETTSTDVAPGGATGLELGALVMTVQLAGVRSVIQSSEIEVAALPGDLNDETWWKSKVEWLNDATIKNLSIHGGTQKGTDLDLDDSADVYYPNELVQGTIHKWMTAGESAAGVQKDVDPDDQITVFVAYEVWEQEEGGEIHKVTKNHVLHYKFVSTNLTTKTYRRTAVIEGGESVPSGVAAKVYAALGTLQYDGQFVLLEEEVSGTAYPGKVLNLTADQAAWASMNALIQEVVEDVDNGLTTIQFGPAEHLGPSDMIELLRANRGRKASTLYAARETGDSIDAGSSVVEEAYSAFSDVGDGGGEQTRTVFRAHTGAYDQEIDNDPSAISKTDADVVVKPREVYIPESATTAKKRQVMCSDSYDTAITTSPTADASSTGSSSTKRSTIEPNPEAGDHNNLWQMYNVDLCTARCKSIPFFESNNARVGGIIGGEVAFYPPDGEAIEGDKGSPDSSPYFSSLRIEDYTDRDAPFYRMEVSGFRDSNDWSTPYADPESSAYVVNDAASKEVTWMYPMAYDSLASWPGDPLGSASMYVGGILNNRGAGSSAFSWDATSTTDDSYASLDAELVCDYTGMYIYRGRGLVGGDGTDGAVLSVNIPVHVRHTDTDPGVGGWDGNDDHDGRYWLKDGTFLQCYGDGVGWDSGAPSGVIELISLDDQTLLDTNANATVDFGSRTLGYDYWSVTDTEAGGDGAGCLRLSGGMYSAKDIYCALTITGGTIYASNDGIYIASLIGGTDFEIYDDDPNLRITFGGTYNWDFMEDDGNFNIVDGALEIGGTQVVGGQETHFADASTSHDMTGSDSVSKANLDSALDSLGTTINNIISVLENHGLMASS